MNYLEANNASVENFKKDVESLTSQLKAHEEKIKLKNDELMKLREEIKKLNLECEGVAIFKIQVSCFSLDTAHLILYKIW